MRTIASQLMLFVVIAVLAVGNGFSFAAPDMLVHHQDATADEHQSLAPHWHSYDHAQLHGEGTSNKADSTHVDIVSEHCVGADCDDSDRSNHPCCHTHVHCCTSLSWTVEAGASKPLLGKGALLVASRASVPLGTVFYPLLRPPRVRV